MSHRALVTGAGGFVGHHLAKYLKKMRYWVRGVDIKYPEFEETAANEFQLLDLRELENCLKATNNVDEVYHLAADMGGIGFITGHHARIARNNTLTTLNMLEASRINDAIRFLYASSACIYPKYLQESPDVTPLKEESAYPADPEKGYGWQKLFGEELCNYYRESYGLETRIVRFHNVYGPLGIYEGGREKAPAALCRKIALADEGGTIEVWGDGKQTRSFMYVDDCIEGIHRLMQSDHTKPLNLGTDRLVTIDELVGIISRIAQKRISIHHDLNKPQGVRGRNSDNNCINKVLKWQPGISLEEGLRHTYRWIESDLKERLNGELITSYEEMLA